MSENTNTNERASGMTLEILNSRVNALENNIDKLYNLFSNASDLRASSLKKTKRAGSQRGTAWELFTKKVINEHPEEFAAFKEAAEVKQGVAPKFVSEYRQKHPNEWEAYHLMHQNPDQETEIAMGGITASAGLGTTPKKVLSPEHLAKMKAGREAKAAAKAAAKGGSIRTRKLKRTSRKGLTKKIKSSKH